MTCQWNLNYGFQSLAGFRIPNAEFRIPKPQAKTFPVPDSRLHEGTAQRAGKTCDLFCCKTSWIERFHSRGQRLCKFIETKRNRLHKKKARVQRPQDWFGTPIWLAWISSDCFESLLLPQLRLNRPAVNAAQWRHYSLPFALIHAKSETRFSSGKPRNIVWKCLHDTELLYFFRS